MSRGVCTYSTYRRNNGAPLREAAARVHGQVGRYQQSAAIWRRFKPVLCCTLLTGWGIFLFCAAPRYIRAYPRYSTEYQWSDILVLPSGPASHARMKAYGQSIRLTKEAEPSPRLAGGFSLPPAQPPNQHGHGSSPSLPRSLRRGYSRLPSELLVAWRDHVMEYY